MGSRDAEEMLEVAKEEVGRLERYNEELGVMLSDQQARYVRDTDILFLARKAAERERDAALAVIANTKARYREFNDADYVADEMIKVLTQSPTDALAEHDRQVKAEALEEAAIDIVLTPVAEWKRHGNPGIRENGEADASAWMDARAAEIRAAR